MTEEFGRGWSDRQLRYCIRFAEVCPDAKIAHTACAQLSWSHLKVLIYLDDDLKRQFYTEMCQLENWSRQALMSHPTDFSQSCNRNLAFWVYSLLKI